MHPVIVYLNPPNYNTKYKVSRSFQIIKVANTVSYDSPQNF